MCWGLSIIAFSQEKQYRIVVKFTNVVDTGFVQKGDKFFISSENDSKSDPIIYEGQDSIVFIGNVDKPCVGGLHHKSCCNGYSAYIKILLENAYYCITIKADDIKAENYYTFKTTSPIHNTWLKSMLDLEKIGKKKNNLNNLYTDYETKGDNQKADSVLNEIRNIEIEKQKMYIEAGKRNPDNLGIAYVYAGISDYKKEYMEIFNTFSPKVKNSEWGKRAQQHLEKLEKNAGTNTKEMLLGNKMPPLQGVLANSNEQLTIDTDYIKKTGKKITIIDFWASWCSPCRQVNKEFIPFYIEHKEKGLGVISFGLDSDKTPWLEAIVKDKLPWINISDVLGQRSPVAKVYNIERIPSNVVVNNQGKIIGIDIFDEEKIKELLKK